MTDDIPDRSFGTDAFVKALFVVCLADAALALSGIGLGLWGLKQAAGGLAESQTRESFAVGTLIGGAGWLGLLAAAITGTLAIACLWGLRRVRRSGRVGAAPVVILALACLPLAALVWVCLS
jgi:hypothetical protein